jgi:hypothetical protein
MPSLSNVIRPEREMNAKEGSCAGFSMTRYYSVSSLVFAIAKERAALTPIKRSNIIPTRISS